MRFRFVIGVVTAGALAAVLTPSSIAQSPSQRPRSATTGRFMRSSPATGTIIGDKHTKVYHMPGDRGTLPKEKNRVYFKTEAEAIAAGYRHAGAKTMNHRSTPSRSPRTGQFMKTPPGK